MSKPIRILIIPNYFIIFQSKNILNVPITLFMSLDSKIIQLCCDNDLLVISTLTRCYICDLVREHYKQIGQQLRDGLYGVTFLKSRKRIFCARPGSRLWEVDLAGDVHSTHQFKRKLAIPPSTFISLFDEPNIKAEIDCPPATSTSFNFVKLQDLLGRYIVTYNGDGLYVLNTDTVDILFWSSCFGTIVDVQCSLNSIFIWNNDGDLHELVFLPAEKYILTLYLKSHHKLCIHVMHVFYEKLVSSSTFHELYPLKDFEWPSEENLGVDHDQKIEILSKIKEKLKTVVANETKLNSGIHVVNNRHLSHRLLDDSVIDVHRSEILVNANGSSVNENGEPRKRSNSLPSSLKKSTSNNQSQGMNGSDKLASESRNLYNGTDTDSEHYNSPFVTFASYHILRDNFSELGANFSQIFNDSSRNLKQKWLTFEGKITSRAEDPSPIAPPVARVPALYQDEEIVEIDNEPIVERRQITQPDPLTNNTDELQPLFNALESNSESDHDLFDSLNVILQKSLNEDSHLPISMTMAPIVVKDIFTSRCFVKPFLSAWFDSKTFPLDLPSDLQSHYPSMLALLFDKEELGFDFFLSSVLAVFGFLLDARNLLDTIKSFQLPCYYKSFCYVLKHFQRDQLGDYERAEGERIAWPTPVYLNTMLLMISVDRKEVFSEMGIKKNVDIVDVLYLLLHAVQIDSKNDSSSLLPEYKNVWLNYIQRQHCEQNINCLENPNVFRLILHALISCNVGLQDLCCSNCWFLLPQNLVDKIVFKSLSCAILDTFWSILTESFKSDGTDYATLLSFRCAISDTFKYQPRSSVCYRDIENCKHLICKNFSKKVEQLQLNPTSVLAFDTICNLCYRIPFLWKYLSTVQKTSDPVQLLDMPHFIQLDSMPQLHALYSSVSANDAQMIFDCLATISEGRCLNCNEKVFDEDHVSWDNASTFVLQHLGATQTLKLLQCYPSAKINLSSR